MQSNTDTPMNRRNTDTPMNINNDSPLKNKKY